MSVLWWVLIVSTVLLWTCIVIGDRRIRRIEHRHVLELNESAHRDRSKAEIALALRAEGEVQVGAPRAKKPAPPETWGQLATSPAAKPSQRPVPTGPVADEVSGLDEFGRPTWIKSTSSEYHPEYWTRLRAWLRKRWVPDGNEPWQR